MNMREKIARAIRDKAAEIEVRKGCDSDPMIHASEFADAVLDALMEPTEDMINASTATPQVRDIDWVSALLGTGISSAEDVALASYRAMIQAARDGK